MLLSLLFAEFVVIPPPAAQLGGGALVSAVSGFPLCRLGVTLVLFLFLLSSLPFWPYGLICFMRFS